MKIIFLGDIALNGHYIDQWRNGENPFSSIEQVLGDSDYIIGNLECISKGENGVNELKSPRLTTEPETLNYLNNIGLNLALLANNHVYDNLESGFKQTLVFLDQNKIQHMGAAMHSAEASNPMIVEMKDIKLGVLNYVTPDTNPNIPDDSCVFVNYLDVDKVHEDIRGIRKHVDHVILQLHWGGRLEAGLYPDYDQAVIAREFIDSGVDLIIGHHSHTIQPYEIYKGKYIFYSLGNFCFSSFDTDKGKYYLHKRNKITHILSINFEKRCYSIDSKFFKNKGYAFQKVNYGLHIMFRNFIQRFLLMHRPIWRVYYFYYRKVLPIYLFLIRNDLGIIEKFTRIYSSIKRRSMEVRV